MSDNLVLELLRAIRADLREIKETLRDQTRRFARIESELVGMRHQAALASEARAERRIGRSQRRLELADGSVF